MDAEERINSDTTEKKGRKGRPATSGSFNLKPLRGVPSESGFYGYSGRPFSNADVSALKDKGVIFVAHPNGDLMPDGIRLKHPKFRSDFRNRGHQMKKLLAEPRLDALTDFDKTFAEWHEEYEADSAQDKPEFDKWLLDKNGYLLVKKQWRNALLCTNPSDSTKAILSILEYNKAKPKQQIALETNPGTEIEWDAKKVLEYALELNGIGMSVEDFKQVAAQRKV